MEWTTVNQPSCEENSRSLKILGSLKTVWADEEESQEDSSSIKHDSPIRPKAISGGSWLARSQFLSRQETEDLYCDDELHPSLENDPNMQLSIAQHAAEHVKPYPPMPMLTDRGNFKTVVR